MPPAQLPPGRVTQSPHRLGFSQSRQPGMDCHSSRLLFDHEIRSTGSVLVYAILSSWMGVSWPLQNTWEAGECLVTGNAAQGLAVRGRVGSSTWDLFSRSRLWQIRLHARCKLILIADSEQEVLNFFGPNIVTVTVTLERISSFADRTGVGRGSRLAAATKANSYTFQWKQEQFCLGWDSSLGCGYAGCVDDPWWRRCAKYFQRMWEPWLSTCWHTPGLRNPILSRLSLKIQRTANRQAIEIRYRSSCRMLSSS